MDKETKILSKILGCSILNLDKIGNHSVYILNIIENQKKCVKIIYGYDNNYESRYRKLESLELVPKIHNIIYANILDQKVIILINEYISSSFQTNKSIHGPLIMALVYKLHRYGYIHNDITEPKNILVEEHSNRAFFIDIDSTFHVDDIDNLDIDLYLEYGTKCPKKIMEFEKKVIIKRLTY